MSKAFTKESDADSGGDDDDDMGLPPLPPGGKNYITPIGYACLRAELLNRSGLANLNNFISGDSGSKAEPMMARTGVFIVKKSARRSRRTHTNAFKAYVALAALREDKTMV
jgi:hypothetical protein